VIDLASSRVRLNLSTVPISGLGASRFTATPMPAFITSVRVSATSLPALIRSSAWKSTSTARSNGSPDSIRRFITAATSATTTGVYPLARSNCGPSSVMIILVTREPKILSSAQFAPLICAKPTNNAAASAVQSTGVVRRDRIAPPFRLIVYPGSANLMAKMIARITTAGLASANFPATSLASA
jgi:hypothetical protein